MSRLTERYKEKVFCKADCSEMIDYAEDCECPHLQKMKEKLANCEDLEEQGLLLKLPCKVHDIVYLLRKDTKKVCRCQVERFNIHHFSITLQLFIFEDMESVKINAERFGEILFRTEEMAKKALAEMEK